MNVSSSARGQGSPLHAGVPRSLGIGQYARVTDADLPLAAGATHAGRLTPSFCRRHAGCKPPFRQHPKRRTIDLRVPDHVVDAGAAARGTGRTADEFNADFPRRSCRRATRKKSVRALEHDVDSMIVDGGFCGLEPTTVVVLDDGQATIARQGKEQAGPVGRRAALGTAKKRRSRTDASAPPHLPALLYRDIIRRCQS